MREREQQGGMGSTRCCRRSNEVSASPLPVLLVQFGGPGWVDGPGDLVVRLIVVVPAAAPEAVEGRVNHVVASRRLDMAIAQQQVGPVVMPVGRPLGMALHIVGRVHVRVEGYQR